jgi:branched-chain amino acid aminotransferase
MLYCCHNGEFFNVDAPLVSINNSGYKYGDAVFETMKVSHGNILHLQLHLERLELSLRMLGIKLPAGGKLDRIIRNILELCSKNNCINSARVRLEVYRRDHNEAGYSIESVPLDYQVDEWNQEGLIIGLFPYCRKSTDAFSNLKTSNFLPYVLAANYAKEHHLDDCLVLNSENNLADSSKANLFLIKGEEIHTPALHQGCVNGIIRRYLIDNLKRVKYSIHQKEVTEEDLLVADEVFLTNSIMGIKWVRQYREKEYTFQKTLTIFQQFYGSLASKINTNE